MEIDKLVKRFLADFGGRIIVTTAGFLLITLLARLLSQNEYGLLFLAIAVFKIFEIFSKLGISKSGARYIAEYKEKRPEQLPHIFRSVLILNMFTITIVTIILFVSQDHLARLIGEPNITSLLLFGIPFIIFSTLSAYVRSTLQGLEEIQLAAGLKVLDRIVRLIAAFLLVLVGFGPSGALAGYILGFAVASVAGLFILYFQYYRQYRSNVPIERGLRRRIAEYSVPITATYTARQIDSRVDTILVGFFLNPAAVSFYVVAKQIVSVIQLPATALGFTLSPMLGEEKAKDNLETATQVYKKALEHTLLLYIPAVTGLWIMAESGVALIFGSKYLGAVPVVRVMGLYALFLAISRPTSNGLDFLGRARSRAIGQGATSILNIVLNIIMIPLFGVVGAAFATVITFGMLTLINIYIMYTELDFYIRDLAIPIGKIISITVVISIIVRIGVDFVSGWITFVLIIILGIFIWGILAIAVGLLNINQIKVLVASSDIAD